MSCYIDFTKDNEYIRLWKERCKYSLGLSYMLQQTDHLEWQISAGVK